MSILDGLNPPQLQAVTLPHQSALILAGAGSGKTRVLITRIAYLISTGAVSPHSILAVTFTNKAAKEMLTRLSAMLPINTRGMWIGTFHGLCNRMLRAHYREANLPQTFQILDSGDQLSAIKRLMKAMNVDDEKYPPRDMQNFISGSKEQGLRANEVEAYDPYTRRRVEVFAEYDAQCQREGVVDFSELLLRCYELLSRNQQLREHYQERFQHILVDEFQDTNKLQYQWLKLLAGCGRVEPETPGTHRPTPSGCKHSALFAVGDDDQSIYAFRGANVGNMQELTRDFHVESVIKLEQNYRSHGNILDAANALISRNRNRLGKNLWTSESGGEPLRVYEAPTDVEEAGFMVSEIEHLQSEGVHLKEMALLYRSNAQSRVLEHALVSAGLSYRVYGGLRFFERQEIKHALAYLRLMENTDDDNALLRIINFPTRGIGARSIEQLQEAAKMNGGGYDTLLIKPLAIRLGEQTTLAKSLVMAGHPKDVPVTQLDDKLFAELSDLKTPTGILTLIEIPQPAEPVAAAGFALLLEDIQDPGNLGSMLRSAAAAGCDAVILSQDCADAWSPKVLRAAMGGHFVLRIYEQQDLPGVARAFSGTLLATSPQATCSLYDCDLRGNVAFLIGNEGAGLSADLLNLATQKITIPMHGQVESLNAAAATAICLFEAVRQRHLK